MALLVILQTPFRRDPAALAVAQVPEVMPECGILVHSRLLCSLSYLEHEFGGIVPGITSSGINECTIDGVKVETIKVTNTVDLGMPSGDLGKM
jgi:hypothetical protein